MPLTPRISARLLPMAGPLLLLLSLSLYHLALLQGPLTLVGKALLLGHFGLVLLWQPLVQGDRQLSPSVLLAFVILLGAVGIWLSWGLLLLWGLLLAALIGGKVFCYPQARARASAWIGVVYVVVSLLGIVMPQMLAGVVTAPEILCAFAAWFALPALGLMFLLGMRSEAPRCGAGMDVVGALVIVLVLAGVLLGALGFMFVARSDYLWALLQALGAMAGALLLLGLVWAPREGFAGLGLELSRWVLSADQSFERWLAEIADLAEREDSPEGLVAAALGRLLEWPGVRGVAWSLPRNPDGRAAQRWLGERAAHASRLEYGALAVEVFSDAPLAPTPAWQLDLMLRILAEFHAARVQAQRLQALSYLRAVHETGARTTHEVKNLLQSLDTLCHLVLQDQGRDPVALHALLGEQLPAIRARLEQAMLAIRQPHESDLQPRPLLAWWGALQTRFRDGRIHFALEADDANLQLPAALFDCVAENLLRNALDKGARRVSICLSAEQGRCSLSVENDGELIPPERAERLFLVPLASDTGLGIGLYQAGRLAESAGYHLSLAENAAACVRFVLRPLD